MIDCFSKHILLPGQKAEILCHSDRNPTVLSGGIVLRGMGGKNNILILPLTIYIAGGKTTKECLDSLEQQIGEDKKMLLYYAATQSQTKIPHLKQNGKKLRQEMRKLLKSDKVDFFEYKGSLVGVNSEVSKKTDCCIDIRSSVQISMPDEEYSEYVAIVECGMVVTFPDCLAIGEIKRGKNAG